MNSAPSISLLLGGTGKPLSLRGPGGLAVPERGPSVAASQRGGKVPA